MSGEHQLLSDWKERDIYGELLSASELDVKAVGSDALAEVTGYAKQSIDRCKRPRSSETEGRQQSLSLFTLADLIVFSKGRSFRILRLLNELAGFQAIPKDDAPELPHGAGAVAGVSRDFADLLHGMSEALRDDGKITADEILEYDLIEAAERLHLDALALKERYKQRVADQMKGRTDHG